VRFATADPVSGRQSVLTANSPFDESLPATVEQLRAALVAERTARLHAERRAEDFKRLLDHLPALVSTARGKDLTYDFVNALALKLGGDRDIIGLKAVEAFPELVETGFYALIQRQLEQDTPWIGRAVPSPYLAEDGRQLYFDVIYQPLHDAAGQVDGLLTFSYDVTDAVEARQRAEHSEQALQAANQVLEAQAEDLQSANEELAAQAEELGAQQEELQAIYDRLRHHADDVEAEVARRTEELQGANEELTALTEELGEQGKELIAQNELTTRIMHEAPVGISFLDRHLIVRRVNAVHLALWGLTEEQVLGKPFFEVFGPEIEAAYAAPLKAVLTTGRPYGATRFPMTLTRDGAERLTYWDFSFTAVDDASGERQGLLLVGVDVSDRVENERLNTEQIAQLQALDRYKDEFLSVISHELRTPLNFITGFASILDDEIPGPLNAAQHEAIGRILNGADRMLLLVDDILDFAKIQSGRFELSPTPTPYRPLVEEVLGLLKPLADAKGLSLEVGDMPALKVSLDAGRIAQVLTNLVGNAIKFTDAGHVRVQARVQDGRLVTEVRDTGCGIPAEHLPKLFNRFQQLDMSATRRAGGTGLGLAISKALIQAHDGEIGVTSQPGVGSVFWFALPLAR
jgi:PAS domain S-box-containing protein